MRRFTRDYMLTALWTAFIVVRAQERGLDAAEVAAEYRKALESSLLDARLSGEDRELVVAHLRQAFEEIEGGAGAADLRRGR
ncbi:MAG TPA: hypothetical protein VFW13_07020 [Phenylobacterium sp.]|nr:hypothetical protein [Phenylobacterium sp.]